MLSLESTHDVYGERGDRQPEEECSYQENRVEVERVRDGRRFPVPGTRVRWWVGRELGGEPRRLLRRQTEVLHQMTDPRPQRGEQSLHSSSGRSQKIQPVARRQDKGKERGPHQKEQPVTQPAAWQIGRDHPSSRGPLHRKRAVLKQCHHRDAESKVNQYVDEWAGEIGTLE